MIIIIKMENDTIIRKFLKNEYAQFFSIAAAIWFFVVSVIIPINNIQNTVTTIQLSMKDFKKTNELFDTRITANTDSVLVLQEQVKNLQSNPLGN